MGAYKNPVVGLAEAGLVAAVIFHALNGLRIIAVDFWSKGPKYQRRCSGPSPPGSWCCSRRSRSGT